MVSGSTAQKELTPGELVHSPRYLLGVLEARLRSFGFITWIVYKQTHMASGALIRHAVDYWLKVSVSTGYRVDKPLTISITDHHGPLRWHVQGIPALIERGDVLMHICSMSPQV